MITDLIPPKDDAALTHYCIASRPVCSVSVHIMAIKWQPSKHVMQQHTYNCELKALALWLNSVIYKQQ
jgi:hypothetical protein